MVHKRLPTRCDHGSQCCAAGNESRIYEEHLGDTFPDRIGSIQWHEKANCPCQQETDQPANQHAGQDLAY